VAQVLCLSQVLFSAVNIMIVDRTVLCSIYQHKAVDVVSCWIHCWGYVKMFCLLDCRAFVHGHI